MPWNLIQNVNIGIFALVFFFFLFLFSFFNLFILWQPKNHLTSMFSYQINFVNSFLFQWKIKQISLLTNGKRMEMKIQQTIVVEKMCNKIYSLSIFREIKTEQVINGNWKCAKNNLHHKFSYFFLLDFFSFSFLLSVAFPCTLTVTKHLYEMNNNNKKKMK